MQGTFTLCEHAAALALCEQRGDRPDVAHARAVVAGL
jgi:hypothetical protein